MNITKVKVTVLSGDGNLKAMASITIDDCFVVTGIKVMSGSNGLFIGMPSRKGKDDKYVDICYPVTKDTREAIQDIILAEYGGGNAKAIMPDLCPGCGNLLVECKCDSLPF